MHLLTVLILIAAAVITAAAAVHHRRKKKIRVYHANLPGSGKSVLAAAAGLPLDPSLYDEPDYSGPQDGQPF